eukprot:gene9720-18723_t
MLVRDFWVLADNSTLPTVSLEDEIRIIPEAAACNNMTQPSLGRLVPTDSISVVLVKGAVAYSPNLPLFPPAVEGAYKICVMKKNATLQSQYNHPIPFNSWIVVGNEADYPNNLYIVGEANKIRFVNNSEITKYSR